VGKKMDKGDFFYSNK